MKVLCIKDSSNTAHTRTGVITVPENLTVKCGEIYTVVEEVTGYGGYRLWRLFEKPANCRYKKEYFSPLSDVEDLEEKVELENSL